jgi:hypothetical protein
VPTSSGVPLWVPLLVGLLGLLGVLYTQWRSDVREQRTRNEARQREQEQWDRQERQQREQWAREDATRSYEQRRDAYLRFVTQFDQVWELVAGRYYLPGHWPQPVPEDDRTYVELTEALRTLRLFASTAVTQIADNAVRTLQRFDGLPPHEGEHYEEAEDLNARLRQKYDLLQKTMRRDLGVPDEPALGAAPIVDRRLPHSVP